MLEHAGRVDGVDDGEELGEVVEALQAGGFDGGAGAVERLGAEHLLWGVGCGVFGAGGVGCGVFGAGGVGCQGGAGARGVGCMPRVAHACCKRVGAEGVWGVWVVEVGGVGC